MTELRESVVEAMAQVQALFGIPSHLVGSTALVSPDLAALSTAWRLRLVSDGYYVMALKETVR